MFWLKQSTAVTIKMGPFLDSTDGNTVEDALTISQADIRVSKNGGAFAQTHNAAGATHDEKGNYGVPLDDTDTATLGTVRVHIHESGALPVWNDFMVLPANVWDSLFGADTLEVDAAAILGTALTETSAGYLAAAFKKLFDVATPTLVASDVMRGTESASTHAAANVWSVGSRELSTPADYKATGFSTHAAADVWSVGTRTLSSFGTLVADIATAVWGAATKTLTAFGFEVTTDSASRTASKADVSAIATSVELAAVETHGDSTWATAAGFSTHDAAAVITALEAATSYKVIYAAAAGDVTGNVAGTEFTIKDPGTATTRLSIVWNDTDRTVTVS